MEQEKPQEKVNPLNLCDSCFERFTGKALNLTSAFNGYEISIVIAAIGGYCRAVYETGNKLNFKKEINAQLNNVLATVIMAYGNDAPKIIKELEENYNLNFELPGCQHKLN